jgi:D-serine deaminase-like pyridoxal phosphate-dependent protein
MTHAGHSYSCASIAEIEDLAEHERATAVEAAGRLRAIGLDAGVVSVGSTPTALHARALPGATETRPGVYMFQDLFQTQIWSGAREDIAVTVLASVTGRRPEQGQLVIDAGGLALSKDRSTSSARRDYGFGLVLDMRGEPLPGEPVVERANQEHGVVSARPGLDPARYPVGTRLRVAPNHVCMMAAMYDRYHVVDGGDEVVATWDRVNGW